MWEAGQRPGPPGGIQTGGRGGVACPSQATGENLASLSEPGLLPLRDSGSFLLEGGGCSGGGGREL